VCAFVYRVAKRDLETLNTVCPFSYRSVTWGSEIEWKLRESTAGLSIYLAFPYSDRVEFIKVSSSGDPRI